MLNISTEVWLISGLAILTLMFFMTILTRMYHIVGPKQAESQRDLEVKRATYLETVKRQQAQADKAYEIQTNVMQQQVIAEAVKVQQIERKAQGKVQEAEILRVEKEPLSTV